MLDRLKEYADSFNGFVGQYADRLAAWYGTLSDTGQVAFLFAAAVGVLLLIGLFYISRITR